MRVGIRSSIGAWENYQCFILFFNCGEDQILDLTQNEWKSHLSVVGDDFYLFLDMDRQALAELT